MISRSYVVFCAAFLKLGTGLNGNQNGRHGDKGQNRKSPQLIIIIPQNQRRSYDAPVAPARYMHCNFPSIGARAKRVAANSLVKSFLFPA
jgi:hypothetical protein